MNTYLFPYSFVLIFLALVGCWEFELPDTKAPGFEQEDFLESDLFDTADISLETDFHTEWDEFTDSDSDTSDTSSGATGLSCPEIPCDVPPDSLCENPSTLRVYLNSGTCFDGECVYAWNLEACDDFGCADGGCLEDPCADVVCDLPPDDVCANMNTLIVWDTNGQCDTEGLCHYAGINTNCPLGCEDRACN